MYRLGNKRLEKQSGGGGGSGWQQVERESTLWKPKGPPKIQSEGNSTVVRTRRCPTLLCTVPQALCAVWVPKYKKDIKSLEIVQGGAT